jgi:RimJ/RimL family protein N-acetyltransferase
MALAEPGRVDRYWAEFFGLAPDQFLQPGIRVVPHASLGDSHSLSNYHGAWLFRHGETGVLSVPPDQVEAVAARAASLTPDALPTPETAEALFRERIERLVGPAYQGYAEPGDFRPCPSPHVRALTPADRDAFARLEAACDRVEWMWHSSLGPDHPEVFGYVLDGEILAACRPLMWNRWTANHGVITHPAHRGRGYGKAVVSASMQRGFERGHLNVYQTLVANAGAVGIARALGCREYGTSLAVRFR